ncbi:universal stress protein [Sphingomonas sp. AR_OL41]|uniref:universal stress protein n=1 Tax=Sphingomonas sp. AR_OL41 TaxID=3042729 RepID=UPI00248136EC|nr:universal stress protein [Sphingomonas sp. AR_OL41]MDH7974782.1 universal stress protein [Sphingomonas sp. AR_OL41]
MITSIAHPTDFSPEGQVAFEHALRLSLVNRCRLDVLHVHTPDSDNDWDLFPHIRPILHRWGFLDADAAIGDILGKTGVAIHKVEIRDTETADGLLRFMQNHLPDLIVMASHGRTGLSRWLGGSLSAEMVRETLVPTLIFGPAAKPFVDARSGQIVLKTVLMPVDHDPAPQNAVLLLDALLEGLTVARDYIHIGDEAPTLLDGEHVRTLGGPLAETLLEQARHADLVAMPMAGRHGLLDAIRGSTTERIVSAATCPVLALPAAYEVFTAAA